MLSLNRVQIIGNVGRDPEVRNLDSGKKVVNLSIATSDKSGDKEYTEWHRVNAWGKLADVCEKVVSKGSPVYVEGKITTRKWKDRDGNDKYSTEILASMVNVLTRSDRKQQSENNEPTQAATTASPAGDDLPF